MSIPLEDNKHGFELDQQVIYVDTVCIVDRFLSDGLIKIRPLDIMACNREVDFYIELYN